MDPLLDELRANGVLTETMLEWALEYQSETGVPMDTALLELDLVDEEGLLCGLQSCFKMDVASPRDLMRVDRNIGEVFPRGFSQSFDLCPVKSSGGELEALVISPLSRESREELRNLFHIDIRQIIAPSHYLALSMGKVYDQPIDARTRELESRLARRRGATGIKYAMASVATATTLTSAFLEVLDFTAGFLDYACLLISRKGMLRVVTANCSKLDFGEPLALPDMDCTFGAAIHYGGYFVGPIRNTEADRRFYRALERETPRWVLVAPVPTAGDTRMWVYSDNGRRGMPARWVAEITLLASRLGRREGDRKPEQDVDSADSFEQAFQALVNQPLASPEPDAEPEAEPEAPKEALEESDKPEQEGQRPESQAEISAIARLREAASQAGVTLDKLVDDLLGERGSRPVRREAAELVGEVKDLFEKLATDIPTQMARGMEAAFRSLAPRISGTTPAVGNSVAQRPAASAGLVRKDAGPREVPSYKSRRCRTKRVKL